MRSHTQLSSCNIIHRHSKALNSFTIITILHIHDAITDERVNDRNEIAKHTSFEIMCIIIFSREIYKYTYRYFRLYRRHEFNLIYSND